MTSPNAEFHACALWTFSVEHYQKPGVQGARLCLQDEHGLDVNVALACLWHHRCGRRALSERDIGELLASVAPPRARVLSIRTSRREAAAASHCQALYRALKHAELLSENVLQRELGAALERWPRGSEPDPLASLRSYLALIPASPPKRVLRSFLGREATVPPTS